MLFGYITLAVAFFLSAVAAYYSILGLVAIFSAAAIPVMIMGGALETGKVIAAMWLHRNWNRAPWSYKIYLLPSLLALMLLTSMGTFGYLSKAHSDQSLVSGDVLAKISLYDEKIKIAKDNIDAARRALKQMDEAVDQTMGRSTTEQGADRAIQVRRSQARERTRLLADIEAEQRKIAELNEAKAPIAAEVRKVEAEVGPIKYIAALIYDDTSDTKVLESAVRWVIILIVIVFDPLAIVLILAGTRHLEWEREKRSPPISIDEKTTDPKVSTLDIDLQEKPSDNITETVPDSNLQEKTTPDVIDTILNPEGKNNQDQTPVIEKSEPELPVILDDVSNNQANIVVSNETALTSVQETKLEQPSTQIKYKFSDGEYAVIDDKLTHISVAQVKYPEIYAEILRKKQEKLLETESSNQSNATFGSVFPKNVKVGHMHVHTGKLPSQLYKFNGSTWIEVDKKTSTSYTHNQEYAKFLVDQIEKKIINAEDMTEYEQEMVESYLKSNPNV